MAKKLTPEQREKKAKEEEFLIKKFWNHPSVVETNHNIVIGNSKKMNDLEEGSAHLIVTSPPYFNAKEYSQWDTLESYVKEMKEVFSECFRVLKPGRKFCLNISDLPEKGDSGVRWLPLGPMLLNAAIECGFEIADRIFWFKTPLKGFQYGSLPYPPSPLICDSIEYLYVLRKPGKNDYSHLTKIQKQASRLKREEYAEYTKQIWTIRRVRLKDNYDGHIAPFPDEIPLRCIKLYSFVGETILDPFGGSGTTTKIAMENKRNSVLYEIKKEYLKHIKDKLNITKDLKKLNRVIIKNG